MELQGVEALLSFSDLLTEATGARWIRRRVVLALGDYKFSTYV